MSRQARASTSLLSAAVAVVIFHTGARADVMTETSTLSPTTTNFSSSGGQVSPLNIPLFDTEQGTRTLDSVSLSFSAQVTNQFNMTFYNPATITDSVSGNGSSGSTPTVTLYEPDGKTALVTAAEPNDPSVLGKSATYGGQSGQTFPQTFSSTLPSTSPYYVAPTVVTANGNQTLTSPAELALFTKTSSGASSISLPVAAAAFSQFSSSSGNGGGGVSTMGTATVTVSYTWHNTVPSLQTVPEPAALVVWGVGGLAMTAFYRARRGRSRV